MDLICSQQSPTELKLTVSLIVSNALIGPTDWDLIVIEILHICGSEDKGSSPRIHVSYVLLTTALLLLNSNDARILTDRNFEFVETCVTLVYSKGCPI
jgi:hypothetical protein